MASSSFKQDELTTYLVTNCDKFTTSQSQRRIDDLWCKKMLEALRDACEKAKNLGQEVATVPAFDPRTPKQLREIFVTELRASLKMAHLPEEIIVNEDGTHTFRFYDMATAFETNHPDMSLLAGYLIVSRGFVLHHMEDLHLKRLNAVFGGLIGRAITSAEKALADHAEIVFEKFSDPPSAWEVHYKTHAIAKLAINYSSITAAWTIIDSNSSWFSAKATTKTEQLLVGGDTSILSIVQKVIEDGHTVTIVVPF